MKKFIKSVIAVMLLIAIVMLFNWLLTEYRNNYFNGFLRAELNVYTSTFERDTEVKYGDIFGYKINSPVFNDAMFYKTIQVKPNTAYKVSCMVKTEDVILESGNITDAGVHISIPTTTEKSKSLIGTTSDWQKLELIFNSKNRTEVNIAFRMGGNDDNCTGTAWFADFKLEQGITVEDNQWNFACFIFKNMDVNLENREEIKLQMTDAESYNIKENIERFRNFIDRYSKNNISATCDIIEIDEPITRVSYDEKNAHFISGSDVASIINPYIEQKSYQHIFIIAKFGDGEIKISVNDWLGLGSMTYRGIGFSNIRVPGDNSNKLYQLSAFNQFPEEVFVHEFMHDLERISKEAEIERPSLHDNAKYGYESDVRVGLKQWYQDYMGNEIEYEGDKVGIDERVFKMKPIGGEYLEYSLSTDFVKEPANVFEEVAVLLRVAIDTIFKKAEVS